MASSSIFLRKDAHILAQHTTKLISGRLRSLSDRGCLRASTYRVN